jgi:hypothetical protein
MRKPRFYDPPSSDSCPSDESKSLVSSIRWQWIVPLLALFLFALTGIQLYLSGGKAAYDGDEMFYSTSNIVRVWDLCLFALGFALATAVRFVRNKRRPLLAVSVVFAVAFCAFTYWGRADYGGHFEARDGEFPGDIPSKLMVDRTFLPIILANILLAVMLKQSFSSSSETFSFQFSTVDLAILVALIGVVSGLLRWIWL